MYRLSDLRRAQWEPSRSVWGALLCLLFALLPVIAFGADIPKAKAPILFTSLGAGARTPRPLSILAGEGRSLRARSMRWRRARTSGASKTVFIAVGTSLKGFGSAGVNLDTETAALRRVGQGGQGRRHLPHPSAYRAVRAGAIA